METIAQQINWDFKTNGYLIIKNKNGNVIYFEHSDTLWTKWQYDSQGNEIYYESSSGYWEKQEYDSKDNEIYYENSTGTIRDNRPKPCDGKVVEIEGVKYKLTKV